MHCRIEVRVIRGFLLNLLKYQLNFYPFCKSHIPCLTIGFKLEANIPLRPLIFLRMSCSKTGYLVTTKDRVREFGSDVFEENKDKLFENIVAKL